MCGIAGYIGIEPVPPERIATTLGLMRRRGPDAAAAFYTEETTGRLVYLLHSRLNIIDLHDRANQPFRSGSLTLSFNGEIYNYVELRAALARDNVFRTESDTEVLAVLLRVRGWAALDDCEGMWAFAAYDAAERTLVLSRDRFGEKPLYMWRDSRGLFFGSEVKFIAALAGRRLPVNFNHLYRYLVNGYKALYKVSEGFFEGVEELTAGTVLTIDDSGNETRSSYWRPTFEPEPSMTPAAAVAGVRERLERAVRLRLRADVPLAFCMSGGLDSNSLIGLAKRRFGYDVHGFTIMNDDARYEEAEAVSCAVREFGVRHTPIPVTTNRFFENLAELVRQHDAPVYTISYYVQWLLMRQVAAHGYRISVSGTGADELLTGYYDHHNLYLYEIRDTPAFAAALAAWQARIAPIVRNPYLQNPRMYFDNPDLRDHVFLHSDRFSAFLTSRWSEPFAEHRYVDSLLRNRMLNELFHEAVPVLLHEDDLNAMYYSIENRSPFLDRELFEFCCRIPTGHLVRDGYAKVLLRDAMAGIVPERILWSHRKVGFNAPIASFVDFDSAAARAQILDDGPIYEHVRRPMIKRLLACPQLANSESKFLFNVLCARMFLEQHAA